jgi:exosortase/archaeosortase family protein
MSVTAHAPATPAARLRWDRAPLAICLAAVGVLVVIAQTPFRGFEATMASLFARAFFFVPSSAEPAVAVFFGYHQPTGTIAIQVTLECSAVLILAALSLLGAAVLLIRSVSTMTALAAWMASCAVLVLFNELRLAFLAAAFHWWGLAAGFERAHIFYGSVISVIGMVLSLVVFMAVLSLSSRGKARS